MLKTIMEGVNTQQMVKDAGDLASDFIRISICRFQQSSKMSIPSQVRVTDDPNIYEYESIHWTSFVR